MYGRGLARPDPEMITAAIGDTGNAAPSGYEIYSHMAIPNLKAEYADNFDVLYERYLKPIGLIQAGYFYKMISDPLIQVEYPGQPQHRRDGYRWCTSSTERSERARARHRVRLPAASFLLPGPMRFLGLSANYSYTQSQLNGFADPGTGYAYRTTNPRCSRQAPNTWNISPTFDTKKFSMRVGMTYNGPMINAYHCGSTALIGRVAKGPSGDKYLYSHYQIDMQGSYKICRGLQIYGYGLNLNNEAVRLLRLAARSMSTSANTTSRPTRAVCATALLASGKRGFPRPGQTIPAAVSRKSGRVTSSAAFLCILSVSFCIAPRFVQDGEGPIATRVASRASSLLHPHFHIRVENLREKMIFSA